MGMRYPRYAVIPSNGRECLKDSVKAIMDQVDRVVIVATGGDTAFWAVMRSWVKVEVLGVIRPEANISVWWNAGLNRVERRVTQPIAGGQIVLQHKWDVAVLNDDAIVPEGWFDAVAGTIRQMGVAAGCSGAHGMPVLHTQDVAPPLQTRMQGFAFILAGELGLRADEQFIWYCGDDDLGRRAAVAGGMVMVPGFPVEHLYPNGQVSGKLMSAIPGDMQRYVDKWGQRPW
jgi:hypothetical protein